MGLPFADVDKCLTSSSRHPLVCHGASVADDQLEALINELELVTQLGEEPALLVDNMHRVCEKPNHTLPCSEEEKPMHLTQEEIQHANDFPLRRDVWLKLS